MSLSLSFLYFYNFLNNKLIYCDSNYIYILTVEVDQVLKKQQAKNLEDPP